MPDAYVSVPIETDPDALAQLAFNYLQQRYPNWTPHDAQLDTWLISALGRLVAELRDVASDVPASIFRYFGASLLNLPPQEATQATVPVTVTVTDTAGYTLPALSLAAGLRDANGVLQGFVNLSDIVIIPGTTTIAATLSAITPGAAGSGLGIVSSPLEIVTALAAVTSVVAVATSSNGFDEETDDDYLNRLARVLSLQAPRPILAEDFATFAKNVAGVGRALALDLYDANLATYGNARTVTVALADSSGNAVGTSIKTIVQANLAAARETNFLVYVIDPTFTTIDVQWNVTAWPGIAASTVNTQIASALGNYLNPASWGNPPLGDGSKWYQQTLVKVNDLIAVCKVAEVKDVNSVLIRTGVASYAATDITLTGPAPMPRLGLNSGTVL